MHEGKRGTQTPFLFGCVYSIFICSTPPFFFVDPLKYFQFCELKVYESNFFFFYSSQACFKGEIVLPGTVAKIIPQTGGFVQSTKTTLLTYPILLFPPQSDGLGA